MMKKLINLINKKLNKSDIDYYTIDLEGIIKDGCETKASVFPDGDCFGCNLFEYNYDHIPNVYGYGSKPVYAVLDALDQLVGLETLKR
jgi:hypothetical protein